MEKAKWIVSLSFFVRGPTRQGRTISRARGTREMIGNNDRIIVLILNAMNRYIAEIFGHKKWLLLFGNHLDQYIYTNSNIVKHSLTYEDCSQR